MVVLSRSAVFMLLTPGLVMNVPNMANDKQAHAGQHHSAIRRISETAKSQKLAYDSEHSYDDSDIDDDDEFKTDRKAGSAGRKRIIIDESKLNGDELRKLESRREYNRRCAARARKRSKDLISTLQKQVDELVEDKAELKRMNDVMKIQLELLEQENRTLLMSQITSGRMNDQLSLSGQMQMPLGQMRNKLSMNVGGNMSNALSLSMPGGSSERGGGNRPNSNYIDERLANNALLQGGLQGGFNMGLPRRGGGDGGGNMGGGFPPGFDWNRFR